MTEDAVNQAVREIAGQYGLSREDSRNLTTVRKALEAQLLEETDRISAAGYDYERMTEYQKRQERAAEAERQRQQTEGRGRTSIRSWPPSPPWAHRPCRLSTSPA